MSFDLHTHTTCSDGSHTPNSLLELALKKGLKGLSITDHDTVEAYPDAFSTAKKLNLQLISGIEFSCHHNTESVHVLGYSFDFTNPLILELCKKHRSRREQKNRQTLEKLKENGMLISEDELNASGSGVIGRPHIAKLLVEKGYVKDSQEAFRLYLGDGKKCFIPGEFFSLEETLNTIHSAQGLAILAHPHLYSNTSFVYEIMQLPFDGIEANYGIMPPEKNQIWIKFAKEKELLITGGSDFHGVIKPAIPLGSTTVSEHSIHPLLNRFYSLFPEYEIR